MSGEFEAIIDSSMDAQAESIPDTTAPVQQPSEAGNHQQLERALNSPPAERRGTNGQFKGNAPKDEQDDYPKSFVAQHRDYWKTLTPDFRGYLSQREQEAHGKISELGQYRGVAETFYGVSQKYQHAIPQGMPHHVAYEHMLAAAEAMEREPEKAFRYLADHYKLDLRKLAGDSGPSEATLRFSVEKFARDKEYFAELEDDIADQIKVIRAREPDAPTEDILQRAYDRAARINQKVSTAIETKRRAAEEKERSEAARKKADEARRIAKLNVRSSTAATGSRGKTWEQTMEDAADNAYRR